MHNAVRTPMALLLATGALLHAGCADDLSQRLGPDANTEAPNVVADAGDNGVRSATIDAHVEEPWIYLDLDSGSEVDATLAESDDGAEAWDLGFRRFHIKLNGGFSGPGQGAAALLPDADFDALAELPAEAAFLEDADDHNDNGVPDYVMSTGDTAWFDYSVTTHVLTPKALVYAVRAADGAVFKFEMLAYYNDAGNGGYPSFRWSPLAAPAAAGHPAAIAPQ